MALRVFFCKVQTECKIPNAKMHGSVIVPKGTQNVFEGKAGAEKEGVTVKACIWSGWK